MRWEGNRQSDQVEDRRGESGGMGGGGGIRLGGGSLGIGGVLIAVVAGWIFGINPLTLLGMMEGAGGGPAVVQQAPPASPGKAPPAQDRTAAFVSTVLADTEDVWTQAFAEAGSTYRKPKLVLFRGSYPTACGRGQSAMGPFYCPGDEKVYIDLAFFDTMRSRLGAPGEFAQAYVIAHEVGHHVQHLLGTSDKIDAMRDRVSEAQANALSVRVELQADCLAGVWANRAQGARQILEQGDVEAALNAAQQIGDDNLQRRSQGMVVPESFTHGTSAQRATWLRRGLQSGKYKDCDTFSGRI